MKRAMAFICAAASLMAQQAHVFRGKVTAVDVAGKRLTAINEPVEGWMGAMTMGYPVENAEVLSRIHVGDQITAKVYEGDFTLHDVALVTQSAPAVSPSALRLADLEAMALAQNPSLTEAQARHRVSEGRAQQAGRLPNPVAGYYGDEIRGGYTGGGKQGGFVSQTIPLGGKRSASRKLANAETEEATAGVEVERTRVLLAVRQGFYHVLAAQRTLDLRERQATLAADTVETANQLANTGLIDRPDVLSAELAQQETMLATATAGLELHSLWRVLAAAAGNAGLPETRVDGDLDAIPDLKYEEISARALRGSPELGLAQRSVARAEAALDSARKAPIPDLTLSATLAHNFEPLETSHLPTGLQGGAQIGVQIPLFDRNQGNIAAARAGIEAAQAASERERLRLQRSVATLFFEYESTRNTALQYKGQILPRAAESLRLYQSNYQRMSGPYSQVLLAQRTLFQLEAEAIRAADTAWHNALALESYGVSVEGQSKLR
jgi:cobalt-zinc-cadmium efflux system outer membrane protein